MATRETAVTEQEQGSDWVRFELQLPRSWHRWLREASRARAMSMGDLVRQMIREFMNRTREREAS